VTSALDERNVALGARYALHQRIAGLAPFPVEPFLVRLVLVDDQDYWKGELAGRRPIRRDYLARLLCAIDAADPAVIALDFDLRSPDPSGDPPYHPVYAEETRLLLDTIRNVATRRPVVLPRTLGRDAEGQLVAESDIWSGFRFDGDGAPPRGAANCPTPGPGPADVGSGFIALAYDVRFIPTEAEVANGDPVESFSFAIAKAYLHGRDLEPSPLVIGSFLSIEDFAGGHEAISSSELASWSSARARESLAHRVVIVGGGWHEFGHGVGDLVDLHETPAGRLPGAFVHANYTEAILARRVHTPIPAWASHGLDVGVSAAMAVVFALAIPAWQRLVAVAAAAAFLVLVSYSLLHNAGLSFDAFLPTAAVVGHALLEKVAEWRRDAREHMRCRVRDRSGEGEAARGAPVEPQEQARKRRENLEDR
jgi:CHASE2 domain-containing sensor protein